MKSLLTLSLIAAMAITTNAQVPSYVPQTNLEGWWSFSGNSNDQSVHARNAGVMGAVLTQDRYGASNSAYSFNGTSDYLLVPATGITNLTRTTVSIWAKYTGDADIRRNYDTYFEFGEILMHAFAYSYNYLGQNFDQYIRCKNTIYPNANINNSWHHIVTVQDSLNTRLYLDGSLLSSTFTSTPTCYGGTSTIYIGASPGDFQYVTGSLDDVGFWTRALTDCEILDLYNSSVATVTLQPQNQPALVGSTATFTVAYNGGSSNYQWQSTTGTGGNFINLPNGGQYAGTTTNTLSVSGISSSNNNQQFRCVISSTKNSCSVVTNQAALMVTPTGISTTATVGGNSLAQNIPNPANNSTVINYVIQQQYQHAELAFTDILGKRVKVIPITKGTNSITINLAEFPGSLYLYSLFVNGVNVGSKKMVISH